MSLQLHHIGKVVKDIRNEYQMYKRMGFQVAKGFEKIQIDKHQKVRVGVIKMNNVFLELLEPLTTKSPITNYAQQGGGFHHLCYKVKNLQKEIEKLKKNRLARQLTPVTISVWNKKPVVFFLDKYGSIFELIQQ